MRRSVFLFVVLCACTFGMHVAAQSTVVTMGITGSGNVIPFNLSTSATWGSSGRYQTAYTGAEINLPGAAQLQEVRVYMAAGSVTTYNNFRLRVSHTTANPTALSNTFAQNHTGFTLSEVIGPANFAPSPIIVNSEPYASFPLTTNWAYNGTDGILLDWSFDNMAGAGFNVPSVGTRTRVYAYNTGANSAQVASGNTDTGAGNWRIQLVFLTGPGVTVTATPGTPVNVLANAEGPGSTGFAAGSFEISTNSQGSMTLSDITLKGSGTGDDSTAYSEVTIYRDANNDSAFNIMDDAVAVTSPGNFSADDGTILFNLISAEQFVPLSTTRRFFVVVRLAGNALPGHTFNFAVEDLTATGGSKNGLPSAPMAGFVIDAASFTVTDASSTTPAMALLGTTGNICQEFTIAYPDGPPDGPSNLSVTGLGSADESADLVDAQLWWDTDQSGSYSAASDTLVDTQQFTQDNGVVDFDMTAHPVFQPGQTRRYFVVYSLNTNAGNLETFQCYVSALSGMSLGGTATGLPSPSANGTAGLEVSANVLVATLNGPLAAKTVNSNTAGPTGDGELLGDVTLAAAPGTGWTVTSLTWQASGTGTHNAAYAQVAVYEDDGNGLWDGAAIDQLAAPPLTGFTAGMATFGLTSTNLPAATNRRFFLAGKLNGTATTGQTFNAALQSVVATPATAGTTSGIPTLASTALVIDTAALTVANSPSQPVAEVHKAGTAGSYTVGRFRLTALNNATTVTSMSLTAGGTGNWTSDVDGAAGLQIYQDDGDGVFGAANDTLLYQGGGAGVITAMFTAPISLQVTSTADLWVRVGLTATAGAGVASTPETFTLAVASAGDVSASSAVLLGTPPPATGALGAIEFMVSSFNPTNDLPKGGKAITIQGSGFMTPFVVKIGGIICPGTPSVVGGTQVTGLFVPPGGGNNLAIEVNSGSLPPQILSNTFTYRNVGGGGSGGSGGGGCTGGSAAWASLAGLVAMLGLVSLRRRRA